MNGSRLAALLAALFAFDLSVTLRTPAPLLALAAVAVLALAVREFTRLWRRH